MGLKEKLEAAGYDTSSMDENAIIQKLDAAGYDTTSLAPAVPTPAPKQGLLSKANAALEVPEKMSREGLGMIADAVPSAEPTGNMARDIALNAPKVLMETLAETAPNFVSKAAILTAGAGKALQMGAKAAAPIAKKVGTLAAEGVEKTVGINADKITNLFKKPLELIAAPTKKAVDRAYSGSELVKAEKTLEDVVNNGTASYGALVKKAGKSLLAGTADGPTLLKGRKALDKQIAGLESQIATAGEGKSALKEALRDKLALRSEFNKALDVIAPKHRAADAMAARQMAVDPFRQIALPGKVNFTSPEGIARIVPGLPSVVGGAVSALGGIVKMAEAGIKSSPSVGAVLAAELNRLRNRKKTRG